MRSVFFRALGAGAAIAGVACSAPVLPREAKDDSEDALSLGSQYTSPLTVGTYMADDGSTVRIENRGFAQHMAVRLLVEPLGNFAGDALVFDTSVNVVEGKALARASFESSRNCDLQLEMFGSGLKAHGTCFRGSHETRVDRAFAKRAPGWLNGTYGMAGSSISLSITDSTEQSLGLLLISGKTVFFSHAGGGKFDAQGFAYEATEKSCRVSFSPSTVVGGVAKTVLLSTIAGTCSFPELLRLDRNP